MFLDLDRAETTRPEVARELRKLESERGTLTPEIVFEAAKAKTSPLHEFFEWDRAKAADKYNLGVARQLIRTVVYRRDVEDHGTIQPRYVPVYVRDPDVNSGEQGYIALRKIIANSPSAHSVVLHEVSFAEGALNRALAVAEQIGFAEALANVLEKVRRLIVRVEKSARSGEPANPRRSKSKSTSKSASPRKSKSASPRRKSARMAR
jgi:hypothetical protein